MLEFSAGRLDDVFKPALPFVSNSVSCVLRDGLFVLIDNGVRGRDKTSSNGVIDVELRG